MSEETPTASENEPNPRKRGLGRGLNALFEDDEDDFAAGAPAETTSESDTPKTRFSAGVDQLSPRADQPRKHFDEESLNELAGSLKEYGVLQPLLVRAVEGSTDSFEIIAGERRWRAAQIAQLHEVPVIVVDMADEDAFKVAMIENLQRENLNPVDEANGYQTLVENFGYTQEQLSSAMGKSRSYIANTIRLRKLPDFVLGHLAAGAISMAHAKVLLGAKNPNKITDAIIQKNLSVREVEKLVDADNMMMAESEAESSEEAPASPSNRPAKEDSRDINIVHLEESLARSTGLNVYINTKYSGKTGKVEIGFKNLDQLDEILKYLTLGATGKAPMMSAPEAEDMPQEKSRASLTARLLD